MTLGEQVLILLNTIEQYYDAREASNIRYWLLEAILDIPKYEVRQQFKMELTEEQQQQFADALTRIANHEPIQYIIGEIEFYGLPFKVDKGVLIPRPETEELVDMMLKDISIEGLNASKILDIGTGSGCIAISLKKDLPGSEVWGVDASEVALRVAEINAKLNEVYVQFDLIDVLQDEQVADLPQFDLIVSNPPYITADEFAELELHVKDFEPEMALIAQDDDPLIFYRRIAELGHKHLKPEGRIYLEMNANAAAEIVKIFTEAGYTTALVKDMQGNERMLKVWLKA